MLASGEAMGGAITTVAVCPELVLLLGAHLPGVVVTLVPSKTSLKRRTAFAPGPVTTDHPTDFPVDLGDSLTAPVTLVPSKI